MAYSGYELLWLFFIYSFLGWVLETVTAAAKQKRFVNRGLINAPFCIIYGTAAVLITVTLHELNGFWLFLGIVILSTVLEWTAGHLIEKMYHEKWWDYSGVRWNLDGYICLPASLVWGGLGFLCVKGGNDVCADIFRLLPRPLGVVITSLLLIGMAVDIMATLMILSGRSRRMEQWEAADAWLSGISSRLGRWIYKKVDHRIRQAYPEAKRKERPTKNPAVFAAGCDFYKVVTLFFVGAFLGDITETLYCYAIDRVWMSRSSVVWGPFSIVWGLAIAAVTALLYRYQDRSEGFLFVMGTFLGGAYEYLCSVFTELAFGTVFWDYSNIPFNLGGRINLLYCFFWGIAAVVWFKILYPRISSWIEKIPVKAGEILTWLLIVFMCCNIVVSCMALIRYDQRSRGIPAQKQWQMRVDERFGDERMEKIYPNALKTT